MKRALVAGTVSLGLLSASASAGVFQDVFHGLQLAATPSGFPVLPTSDGTRVNGQRAGRVRIIPETLGQGYSLEFNRSFGLDSGGRPETFDLGPVDLQLNGNTAMTAGFTRRGFLIGSMNVNAQGLDYLLRAKSGIQDAELSGTIDANSTIEINQFGFYTINTLVTNSGSRLTVDGVVADDFVATDLGVGPINIEGNIFIDILASGLAQAGVDTSGLETLFPRSPIDQITNSIQQGALNAATAAGLLDGTAQVRGAAFGAELPSDLDSIPTSLPNSAAAALPEPATLAMLLLGAIPLMRRR